MKTVYATFMGDGVLEAKPGFDCRMLAENYTVGSLVKLQVTNPRSLKQLNYYFALLHEIFINLPDDSDPYFSTEEHLRAWTLYKTGHSNVHTMPVTAASQEMLAALRRMTDKHLFFEVMGNTLFIFEPLSIALQNMGQAAFNDFFKQAKELYLGLIPGLTMKDLDARIKDVVGPDWPA